MGETHNIEDAVQLVVMVGIARLNVFLPAVEDRFRSEQFRKDAPDGPDICPQNTEVKHTKRFYALPKRGRPTACQKNPAKAGTKAKCSGSYLKKVRTTCA